MSLCLALACIMFLLLFSFRNSAPSDAKLVIGTNAEFPPFTFRQDGKIVGFDIDIAKEVCSRLGKEALFKDMPFDGLIPDLSLGQVDFIAAGMTPTPERAKRVSFTEPYLKEDPLVALVLAEAAATPLEDLNSLEGKKIVVNEGYTADLLLSGKEELDLIRLASPTDGFLALKSGRADVFVTAKSTLHSFLKTQNPGEFHAFPLLNENPDTCALVVAKNNPDLLHKIQAALDEMQQDGTIAQIKMRWNLGD